MLHQQAPVALHWYAVDIAMLLITTVMLWPQVSPAHSGCPVSAWEPIRDRIYCTGGMKPILVENRIAGCQR